MDRLSVTRLLGVYPPPRTKTHYRLAQMEEPAHLAQSGWWTSAR